jgi:hypothetical protein
VVPEEHSGSHSPVLQVSQHNIDLHWAMTGGSTTTVSRPQTRVAILRPTRGHNKAMEHLAVHTRGASSLFAVTTETTINLFVFIHKSLEVKCCWQNSYDPVHKQTDCS